MRKFRKIFALSLVISLIFLCACKQEKTQTYPPQIDLKENQLLLFEPFSYALGIYDNEELQWNPIDAKSAFFQSFGWGNAYPYYVAGQHGEYPFSIGKVQNSTLSFNFSLDNTKQAIAPFAYDGENFYYIVEQITETECLKEIITVSDSGERKTIAKLDGMPIMGGIVIGDYLYFTCAIDDSDFYEIWSLNLKEDTTTQKPKLVRNDYNYFGLYQYGGELLSIDFDKKFLYNDKITIKTIQKPDLILIDEEANILAEKYITPDGNLELAFTDILSGEILGVYTNAINFIRNGLVINIYGNGFKEQLILNRGN